MYDNKSKRWVAQSRFIGVFHSLRDSDGEFYQSLERRLYDWIRRNKAQKGAPLNRYTLQRVVIVQILPVMVQGPLLILNGLLGLNKN